MNNQSIIEIHQLRKSFDQKEVLLGIDLSIPRGQIIGYIGPNGAGKSTTVKILCGLISDFQGEVTILDKNLRTNSFEIKKQIGYIPENAALYETLTPIEFMEFIGEIRGMDAERVRDKAQKLMQLFEMQANIDQRIATFSKGMRQKVLICSALLHNPEIIFMDEPLSGLDANSVIVVKEMLSQLARDGKTIFYSSHLMDVVEKVSHRIVLIDKGKVIADGSFEELRQLSGAESLERLFSRLTDSTDHEEKAGKFVHLFEN